MMIRHITLLLVICPVLIRMSRGADLYVSTASRIGNPGTKAAPFHTLAAASDVARGYAGKETVTVHVAEGVYYLPEPLLFTSVDSGSAEHPVTYRAEREGGLAISGGVQLILAWEVWQGGSTERQFRRDWLSISWL